MFLKTIAAAVGQLFYSMSIAMGIMVTYAHICVGGLIEGSVRQIEIFDTAVAFLAGLSSSLSVHFSGGDKDSIKSAPDSCSTLSEGV